MHLYDGRQHFEGHPLGPDCILIRGEMGGLRPELVSPALLLERAVCLTERRTQIRRLGPPDRRWRQRNGDRRGVLARVIPAIGRRRGDVFEWSEDRAAAELTERLRLRRRLNG